MASLHNSTQATPPGAAAPEGADACPVRLTDVWKQFRRADGTVVRAVDGTSLTLGAREFLVLLGPSGCGKTTLLRSIAGLERPDGGEIELFGQVVSAPARRIYVGPERRGLSMIFQSYALWPHMSVAANVAYPLKSRGQPRRARAAIAGQVEQILDRLGIGGLARQYPHQLSGGQQQRVALARALVDGSRLVLFDEPMSNVDAKVREHVRLELRAMQREIGFAAVYVTHDQGEAMQLADRVAVISAGRIVQLGPPGELYRQPQNLFAARFVGTSNEMAGTVVRVQNGTALLGTESGELHGIPVGALSAGQRAVAVWRPERCQIHTAAPGGPNAWPGQLVQRSFLGAYVERAVDIGGHVLQQWGADEEPQAAGNGAVWLSVRPRDVQVFPEDDI
ncbi:MAG TPA: ABC transporter ATP-binding protein [Trebonia sp.]|jgi:iron(III) transport system ATP-binding protein|nr:ABC transporter ATP-binding protein [Trebonia sp.]